MLNASEANSFRQVISPLASLVTRNSQLCAAPGCKHRLPAWSGLWGGRRGMFANSDWFCAAECLRSGLIHAVEVARVRTFEPVTRLNRMPLGLILMARRVITHEQLKVALTESRTTSSLIGHVLIRRFGVAEEIITQAIAIQSSCAVLRPTAIQESCLTAAPLELIERFKMLPIHFSSTGKSLYIGFKSAVDRGILYGLEQMLETHIEPCIIADSVYNVLLQKLRPEATKQVVIDTFCRAEEIAETVCGYAEKTRDAWVRHTTIANRIWIRVVGSRSKLDLVFARDPVGADLAMSPKVQLAASR